MGVQGYHFLSIFNYESLLNGEVMDTYDKWLTIDELASYIKMSRTKLYGMAQRGEIPASKIGTQWRFDRDRIDDWMNEKMSLPGKRKTGAQHA